MVTSLYESKNRYYSRSRITEAKFRRIIRFFAMDFTASDTAKLTNISVRSINTLYIKLRKKLPTNVKRFLLLTALLNSMTPILVLRRDGWRCCDGLVDIGFDKHLRVNHGYNSLPVENVILMA